MSFKKGICIKCNNHKQIRKDGLCTGCSISFWNESDSMAEERAFSVFER